MNKKIAVVIPNHTESLTKNEKISLMQIKKVLHQYDIFFLIPDSAGIDYACAEIGGKRISDDCFSSWRNYNQFMLKPELYEAFAEIGFYFGLSARFLIFEDRIDDFMIRV